MKCLGIFLILISVLALSSCTDIERTTPSETTPSATTTTILPISTGHSLANIQEGSTVDLAVLKDLLLKTNNDFRTYFRGQSTQNVIGFIKDTSGCEIPVLEFIISNNSYSVACSYFDCYSSDMLLLELRRRGVEVVNDRIGRVAAAGENRYLIHDGTSTNLISTFDLIYQDESIAVVSVGCYSDTDKEPKPYEYTFDITNKNHPIVIDISGYGLQSLKERTIISNR